MPEVWEHQESHQTWHELGYFGACGCPQSSPVSPWCQQKGQICITFIFKLLHQSGQDAQKLEEAIAACESAIAKADQVLGPISGKKAKNEKWDP